MCFDRVFTDKKQMGNFNIRGTLTKFAEYLLFPTRKFNALIPLRMRKIQLLNDVVIDDFREAFLSPADVFDPVNQMLFICFSVKNAAYHGPFNNVAVMVVLGSVEEQHLELLWTVLQSKAPLMHSLMVNRLHVEQQQVAVLNDCAVYDIAVRQADVVIKTFFKCLKQQCRL